MPLTRFVFLRLLGLVHVVAFTIAARQLVPLVGHDGLLPATRFLADVHARFGGPFACALRVPTFFLVSSSDTALRTVSLVGLALAIAELLGVTNALLQFAIWAFYLSIVHVGQIFYGYGWETLLCEATFLSIFLCPVTTWRPLRATPPPVAVIWLLRWLAFRVMLGAGLIKLRGDPCWRDLTCLVFHYETQPNPSPLSFFFHALPPWVHTLGVLTNHVVEVVVPFALFVPARFARVRNAAGIVLVAFQLTLIASGNLSFLNWLTLAVCVAAFDDAFLARFVPRRLGLALLKRVRAAQKRPDRVRRGVVAVLVTVIVFLSVSPTLNLISNDQAMNASFEPLFLVNTYGAFGSIERERHEIVLEGLASDRDDPDDESAWREYAFPCKPGDVERAPCLITPYHLRLDWQMWFAAMGPIENEPWLVNLVWKLLHGDPNGAALLAGNPFPDPHAPPKYVRAVLYRYAFTRAFHGERAWWARTRIGLYLRPVRADDEALRAYLARAGLIAS